MGEQDLTNFTWESQLVVWLTQSVERPLRGKPHMYPLRTYFSSISRIAAVSDYTRLTRYNTFQLFPTLQPSEIKIRYINFFLRDSSYKNFKVLIGHYKLRNVSR